MTCNEVRDNMCEYLDGVLDAALQAEFTAHLDACGPCRQEADQIRSALDFVRQAGDVAPPAGLRQNVLAQLQQEKRQRRRRFAPWFPQAAAAAAIFMMLLAVNVLPATQNNAAKFMDTSVEAPASLSEDHARSLEMGNAETMSTAAEEAEDGRRIVTDSEEVAGESNPWKVRLIFNVVLSPVFVLLALSAVKKRKEALP